MFLHLIWLLQNSAQILSSLATSQRMTWQTVLHRDVMTQLLDKHCPVVEVRRRVRPATPWFDAECRDVRRKVRAAERRFRRRRRTDADKRVWADKLKEMRELYEAKCSTFWRTAIAANKDDSKKLWRALHGVLGDATTEETGTRTADEFATYFKDKIDSVRESTASTPLFDVPTKRGRHWHSGLP